MTDLYRFELGELDEDGNVAKSGIKFNQEDDQDFKYTPCASERSLRQNAENDLNISVGFKRLRESATLPTKAHASDSGFDLVASEDVIIEPGETAVIPTGIAVSLPGGFEATVRPRSGVTAKTRLRVQLGTIDEGYRGEIGVIVDNIYRTGRNPSNFYYTTDGKPHTVGTLKTFHGEGSHIIRKGDRIAQLVIQPVPSVEAYEIAGDIKATERGASGYGSTGVRDDVRKEFIQDSPNENHEALSKLAHKEDE